MKIYITREPTQGHVRPFSRWARAIISGLILIAGAVFSVGAGAVTTYTYNANGYNLITTAGDFVVGNTMMLQFTTAIPIPNQGLIDIKPLVLSLMANDGAMSNAIIYTSADIAASFFFMGVTLGTPSSWNIGLFQGGNLLATDTFAPVLETASHAGGAGTAACSTGTPQPPCVKGTWSVTTTPALPIKPIYVVILALFAGLWLKRGKRQLGNNLNA